MKKVKNKGITLIALVITIIVLLILAGVTIVTLTGKNGILTKGTAAREQTERESVIEEARTEILAVQADNEGKLTKAQMIAVLEKFFQQETIPSEKELPEDMSVATQKITTKAEYGNHEILISQIWNGKFSKEEGFNPETFTLGTEAQNTEKYGWKVKDYTVKTEEFTTGVWRLFYQDNDYTYLIADECVGNYRPSDWYTKYETQLGVNLIGKKLNLTIIDCLEYKGTFSWGTRRATEWLTNSTIWENYKNEDAVFAIGSPTLELFALSYNNTEKDYDIQLKKYNFSNAGYEDNTKDNCLKIEDNYGIYNKSTENTWWLASPGTRTEKSMNRDSQIICINGEKGRIDIGFEYSNFKAIRPVVCISNEVFDKKYAKSLVDE